MNELSKEEGRPRRLRGASLDQVRRQAPILNMWRSNKEIGHMRNKKRGCSIIILGSDRKVLLYLRDDKPYIPFPNQWDVLGGNVEENETPEQCIAREMLEEIETAVEPALFKVYDMPDRLEYVFWQQKDMDLESTKLNEGQRLRWFAEQEVRSMPRDELAFQFCDILVDFFNNLPVGRD